MEIKQQLEIIALDLSKGISNKLGSLVSASIGGNHNLILKSENKEMNLDLRNSHVVSKNQKELTFKFDELENHNYTELAFVVQINTESELIEYVDYPPYATIAKHFSA